MGTKTFIALVTGIALGCLGIVSLNGIPEHMVACWPLAIVVSSGLITLGLIELNRSKE